MKKTWLLGVLSAFLLICPFGIAAQFGHLGSAAEVRPAGITETAATGDVEIPDEDIPLADAPQGGLHKGVMITLVAVFVLGSVSGSVGILFTAASGSAISSGGDSYANDLKREIEYYRNASAQKRDVVPDK